MGDARVVTRALTDRVLSIREAADAPWRKEWFETLDLWQTTHPLSYDQQDDGPIKTQAFIERLHEITGGDAVVAAGVGQHQMWASQYWQFDKPNNWVNSGGAGTMGFSIPSAIGAQVARPDDTVIALDGDGCFQMTFQELITATTEEIPIKVVVFNNAGYGMVKQWQNLFYEGRISASYLPPHVPDYPKLAEAMGCFGMSIDKPEAIDEGINKILEVDDRPAVIEVVCDPDELCFPMVPAGGSNDIIVEGPDDL